MVMFCAVKSSFRVAKVMMVSNKKISISSLL